MDSRLLAFLGIATLLIITPGPDMATVTKNALGRGRRGALLTTLGIGSAILVHVTIAALGLSALLRTASGLYTIVKLCGAAYLTFLGLQTLWSARLKRAANSGQEQSDASTTDSHWSSSYRQGFVSALLNPKLVVFFATFLPQFVAPGQPVLTHMLLLGVLFDILGMIWLSGYGLLVTQLRTFFASPIVRRRMELLTGAVLVALGARLALERS
jgi:threonine/homoserine/homoserine lactone efflux protein